MKLSKTSSADAFGRLNNKLRHYQPPGKPPTLNWGQLVTTIKMLLTSSTLEIPNFQRAIMTPSDDFGCLAEELSCENLPRMSSQCVLKKIITFLWLTSIHIVCGIWVVDRTIRKKVFFAIVENRKKAFLGSLRLQPACFLHSMSVGVRDEDDVDKYSRRTRGSSVLLGRASACVRNNNNRTRRIDWKLASRRGGTSQGMKSAADAAKRRDEQPEDGRLRRRRAR